MGKKAKHPEHENLERWLVSYADFITLLFATFTALYALAQSDLSKLKDVSAAVREGFQEQSIMSGIKSIMQGKSAPNDNPNPLSKQQGAGPGVIGKYDSLTYSPGEVKKVEKTYEKLKGDVKEINERIDKEAQEELKKQEAKKREEAKAKPPDPKQPPDQAKGSDNPGTHAPNLGKDEAPAKGIDVAIQERGLKVSFDSRLLFEPGTAVLKKESLADLNTIASRLIDYNRTHVIHVEGHTDNEPIASALYPSNWELSAARASTVVRYLIKNHRFSPSSLVAVGYGDSQPIASNATAEGRRTNRRVDIVIYSRKVEEQVNPTKQFMKQTDLIKGTPKPPEKHSDQHKTFPVSNIQTHPLDSASYESNLIQSEERDEHNQLIRINGEPVNPNPVKVIIKDPQGSERVIHPKTTRRRVVDTGVKVNKPKISPNLSSPPVPPAPSDHQKSSH